MALTHKHKHTRCGEFRRQKTGSAAGQTWTFIWRVRRTMSSASMKGGGNGVCCFTFVQCTRLTAFFSSVFAILVFAHEVAIEGGFDVRNYVVLAFCTVWVIVTSLLVLGTLKKAHFLFLPWLIFSCVLTPVFLVGIVAGCKVFAQCLHDKLPEACRHEYHILGTTEPVAAGAKLAAIFVMLISNSCSIVVVYKYYMILCADEERKKQKDDNTEEENRVPNVRYERFEDEADPESHEPLCENSDENAT